MPASILQNCTRVGPTLRHILASALPGIVRDAAHFDFDEGFFGQQAVYRVSMGNFSELAGGCMERLGSILNFPTRFVAITYCRSPCQPDFGCGRTYLLSSSATLTRMHAHPAVFFAAMSLALLGVKVRGDKRDRYLHHGHYLVKLAAWALFNALPFLFPNGVVDAYGARMGMASAGGMVHRSNPTSACVHATSARVVDL
jgi:hypothetical protein